MIAACPDSARSILELANAETTQEVTASQILIPLVDHCTGFAEGCRHHYDISSAHAQLIDNSAGQQHFIICMSMHNPPSFAGTCLAQLARDILLIHCDLPRWCCCLKVALY